MAKQKHYFKQKIYFPDELANRSIYLDGSTIGIRNRNRNFLNTSQCAGKIVSEEILRSLKNKEEQARMLANKDFSTRIWKTLLERKQHMK